MKNLFYLTLICFTLISCSKENDNAKDYCHGELVIKSGEVCGWCSKNDTLLISAHQARLKTYQQCDSLTSDTTITLNSQQWNDLIGKLDLEKFKALNLNSCAVCYDGCDSWVSIRKDSFFHQIRYESSDSTAVQSIQSFIDELADIGDSSDS